MGSDKIFTIPNWVTFSRLFFGLATFLLIVQNKIYSAAVVYFVGALTDTVDGKLARKLKKTSKFGSFLDALIDRIFILIVLIALLIRGSLDLFLQYIIIAWLVLESVFGFILTIKTRKFYLESVHRNSIRITAFVAFVAIGWKILELPYLKSLFWLLLILAIITFIDYSYLIFGSRWSSLERIEARCKKIPIVNIFFK